LYWGDDVAYDSWLSDKGVILEEFEVLNNWTTNGNCSIALETGLFKTGVKSMKITGTVTGAANVITKTACELRFSTTPVVGFWIYITDITKIATGGFNIYLSSNNFTSYFTVFLSWYGLKSGWNLVKFKTTDWTNHNTEAWTNVMTDFRINFTSATGEVGIIYMDSLFCDYKSKAYCIITADDCWQSFYDYLYAYAKSKSIKLNFGCISSRIGQTFYLAQETLKKLYAEGHDIVNHTSDHTNLTTLTAGEIATKINDCDTFLTALGFTRSRNYLLYPYNAYNDTVLAAVLALGYINMARNGGLFVQQLPLDNALTISSKLVLNDTTDNTAVETAIDDTIAKGGVCMVYGHQIITSGPPDSNYCLESVAKHLIDYLDTNKTSIQTITFSELWKLLSVYPETTISAVGSTKAYQDIIPASDYMHIKPVSPQEHIYMDIWANGKIKVYRSDGINEDVEIDDLSAAGIIDLKKHFCTNSNFLKIKNDDTKTLTIGYSGMRLV